VRIRGPGVIPAYDGDPQESARSFRDGGFWPGDLACWTDDGQLLHHGRADDMMICDGINIYPEELESVLLGHPEVRDAVAFAIDSPAHHHVPACAVVLRPGSRVGAPELVAFAAERIGSRAPRVVLVRAALPRTANGKPMRAELRRGAVLPTADEVRR
jgi:acyl-coenzyme A synthetase/AMP-(fatty) acid ligase